MISQTATSVVVGGDDRRENGQVASKSQTVTSQVVGEVDRNRIGQVESDSNDVSDDDDESLFAGDVSD